MSIHYWCLMAHQGAFHGQTGGVRRGPNTYCIPLPRWLNTLTADASEDVQSPSKPMLVNMVFWSCHLLCRKMGSFRFLKQPEFKRIPLISLIYRGVDLAHGTLELTFVWQNSLNVRSFNLFWRGEWCVIHRGKIMKGLLPYCPAIRRLMELRSRG